MAAVGLSLCYRIWITAATPIPLFFDEAYYLSWAQHLDWGYYSKPPMVAWLIALTTEFLGNAAWAVKLAAPVLYSMAAILIYLCGLRLTGNVAGMMSGLIFLFMPLVAFNSLFITTDAPLLFFWSLSTYAFLRALESDAWIWWLLAGLAGGFGLLSKYTFVLLPTGFLLWACFSPLGRKLLQNPKFWLACTLAALCLMPNLYWNYQHQFISFQHTAEISKQADSGFNPLAALLRTGEFILGQALVFGPVFFVLISAYLFKKNQKSHATSAAERLLWSLFLPCFLVIGIQALSARANVNWAAPSYIAASLLAGLILSKRGFVSRWWRWGMAVNLLLMLSFYHFAAVTDTLGIERKKGNDPFKRVLGWDELAQSIQAVIDQNAELPILGNSRKELSYLGYYLKPQHFEPRYFDGGAHIDNHYELKYALTQQDQGELLYIGNWPQARLESYFEKVEFLSQQTIQVYGNFSRTISVYRVQQLKPEAQWTAE
ncbi:glycosyltransferase family 39 protein [Spongiibacter sp. KMU-158]|uniref:Glycosyltransferase family 39 protein n=2 Tax=Spongiibacter pelagi TaxID=2760804 RepID=A0A927C2A0_9GAMM|nr:glycosyltransferase family 39 protein [Spongiibacter pelagi]